MVLDEFAQEQKSIFKDGRLGSSADVSIKGRALILLKPSTYVNLSGKAVNYWLQNLNIPLHNLLVIVDDIALPLGTLRVRAKGGDGGHNGLSSISETLQTTEYARLRFGIGNDFPKGRQSEYVLGKWTETEREVLKERIPVCIEIIKSFVFSGLQNTMTSYNNK